MTKPRLNPLIHVGAAILGAVVGVGVWLVAVIIGLGLGLFPLFNEPVDHPHWVTQVSMASTYLLGVLAFAGCFALVVRFARSRHSPGSQPQ